MSGSLSTRNDCDQVYLIAPFQHMADDRMSAFMAGNHSAIFFIHFVALLFRTHLNPCNRVDQQLLVDFLLAGAGSQNGRFIHHVFQISACGIRHPFGYVVQIHIFCQRLSFAVNLQNGNTSVLVRIVHSHLPIEPAGTHQSRIENIPAVGRRHHNNALIHGKPVHLNQ